MALLGDMIYDKLDNIHFNTLSITNIAEELEKLLNVSNMIPLETMKYLALLIKEKIKSK